MTHLVLRNMYKRQISGRYLVRNAELADGPLQRAVPLSNRVVGCGRRGLDHERYHEQGNCQTLHCACKGESVGCQCAGIRRLVRENSKVGWHVAARAASKLRFHVQASRVNVAAMHNDDSNAGQQPHATRAQLYQMSSTCIPKCTN